MNKFDEKQIESKRSNMNEYFRILLTESKQ